MNDRADRGIASSNAFDEVDGALRVGRAFHVNAQKIFEAGGALDDGAKQTFAKLNVDVQTELRELAGNVGVQPFLGDAFKNLEISIAGVLCIGNRGNIFAEVIEAGVHSRVIALAGGGNGFIQRLAGDESACHLARGAIGSDPIGEAFAFGKLEQGRPEHAGTIMAAWERRNYCLCSSRNFSASIAAMQPEPAAVTAWR